MAATITKVSIVDKPMETFFARRRGESVQRVDAWNVEGRTEQRRHDIQTRDYARAVAYAQAINADDEALIEKMLEESEKEMPDWP
jgi:hypothetical protein